MRKLDRLLELERKRKQLIHLNFSTARKVINEYNELKKYFEDLEQKDKKWLPDISRNFTFYETLFENDLGKEKYDECRKSLIKLNEILGDEYKVKLTGNIWYDLELLDAAKNNYRREYMA